MSRRILVLFPDEWDLASARDPRHRGRYEFLFEGFDLFSFPDKRGCSRSTRSPRASSRGWDCATGCLGSRA